MDPIATPSTDAALPTTLGGVLTAEAPSPTLSEDALRSLGMKLSKDFDSYDQDRRLAELQWARNLRQFLGVYDPETEKDIPKDRSRAYPKLTRVKCVSMVARLMNLLFPAGDKNWAIDASPVPNLSQEDLQSVLDQLQQAPDAQLTDDTITAAVREFAAKRAKNLEAEIEDQLKELGGSRTVSFVTLCKRVLMSGVMYGAGVAKGPCSRVQQQRRWTLGENNTVQAVTTEALVPEFEFCPLWDYYPDMSAKYLHQMDGQFQRMVMSRQQVRKLADNADFMGDRVRKYLRDNQTGNYKQRQFETELKTLGAHLNTSNTDGRKYEVIAWDGGLAGHYLKGCGIEIDEANLSEMYHVIVWLIGDTVIRCSMNPWSILGEDDPIPSYHHFIFEEDESNLLGNGLPQIMRDSQLGVSAATRMAFDNAGIVCGPQVEVNTSLLVPGQDRSSIHAYKVWERDDETPQTMNVPAVREIQMNSHIPELLEIAKTFETFADQETFVNAANGGDMSKGPSEPFRTAAGASMIKGDAALPFKDVVRNFDLFTESVIGSLVMFNRHFNTKPSIKGDFQVVSRGSTSLMAKEVLGMHIDNIASTLTPGEQLYVDSRKMLRQRLAVRDAPLDIMVDDAEATRREQAQAQQQQQKDAQASQFMQATIRKTLAEAIKNMTQSDKNSAAADAAVWNAILAGLEKGVTPQEVAEVRSGDNALPQGVIDMKKLENPKPPTPTEEAAAA
jgi:uncharacterized membrane protein